MAEARILVGRVVGVHGVRGLVRLQSFMAEPADLLAYQPVMDSEGRVLTLSLQGQSRGVLLVAVAGVADRDTAARLVGQDLYLPRGTLPPLAAGEFYQADLLGRAVVNAAGVALGRIVSFHDYGAGLIAELQTATGHEFAPCHPPFLLRVAADVVCLDLPADWARAPTKKKPDAD